MQYEHFQMRSQAIRYLEESYLDQDAATLDLLRQHQQQQTFTFVKRGV